MYFRSLALTILALSLLSIPFAFAEDETPDTFSATPSTAAPVSAAPIKIATPVPPTVPTVAAPHVAPPAPVAALPSTAPIAIATPAPTPSEKATPVAAVTPTPTTSKEVADTKDPFLNDLKQHCARHFPGLIQGEIRMACLAAGQDFARLGKSLVQTRCRLNYGEEPRLVMACLVGSAIADDVVAKKDDFKKKLQLCAEHYPMHTEIDAFLQEGCLTGIHISDLMISNLASDSGALRADVCRKITPERSFIGPCAVGMSFAQDLASAVAPGQMNKSCEQYFDHSRFHAGYRACLVARSLGPDLPTKYADALKSCRVLVSEADVNDTESAACFVGLDIYRHLQKQDDIAKRFQKCGTSKVNYAERDILACLTAASLLDFADKNGADNGCREVFKTAKNRSRTDCVNSLGQF